MTDPQQFVAAQIGQQAELASEAPGQAVAAPAAGLGVTSVDIEQLAATITAMQARITDLEAEKAAEAGNPLAGTVATIQHFLGGHGDPRAVQLGDDLAAAVEEAGKSGSTSRVSQIAAKLDRHLSRNAPYAGENYHYRNAVAFVSDLPDLVDDWHPIATPDVPPANVVAGSVIG